MHSPKIEHIGMAGMADADAGTNSNQLNRQSTSKRSSKSCLCRQGLVVGRHPTGMKVPKAGRSITRQAGETIPYRATRPMEGSRSRSSVRSAVTKLATLSYIGTIEA